MEQWYRESMTSPCNSERPTMFQRAFMRMSAKSLKTGKGTFMSIIFGAHILRVTTPLRCLFSCLSCPIFILLPTGKERYADEAWRSTIGKPFCKR
ncbi:hypothetical protein PEC311524_21490 [Pectobacterium carotovorum subsp. carotovorum]|nr:hypothetical protein PEC311524_21490 [Pectobacterium carotovorum subsp. carotovorum]